MSQAPFIINCDGLCEPRNPGGFGCWGFLVVDADGNELDSGHGCIGHGPGMTNNRAEYAAVLEALAWVEARNLFARVIIRTDSQLVVNQVTGKWDCNSPVLQPLCRQAQVLGLQLGALFEWIPRTQNAQADALSRRAYVEAQCQARGHNTHVKEVAA